MPDISISIMIIVQFRVMDSNGAGETQFHGCYYHSLKVRLICLAKVLLEVFRLKRMDC